MRPGEAASDWPSSCGPDRCADRSGLRRRSGPFERSRAGLAATFCVNAQPAASDRQRSIDSDADPDPNAEGGSNADGGSNTDGGQSRDVDEYG